MHVSALSVIEGNCAWNVHGASVWRTCKEYIIFGDHLIIE